MRALPLKETTKTRLATLINGDTKRDAALLVADLRNEFLDPRSRAVLDNYEHASESGKKIIEGTASMAAQPKPAPNVAVSGGIHQTSHAAGGVQVGLAMGQVNVKQKGKKKP